MEIAVLPEARRHRRRRRPRENRIGGGASWPSMRCICFCTISSSKYERPRARGRCAAVRCQQYVSPVTDSHTIPGIKRFLSRHIHTSFQTIETPNEKSWHGSCFSSGSGRGIGVRASAAEQPHAPARAVRVRTTGVWVCAAGYVERLHSTRVQRALPGVSTRLSPLGTARSTSVRYWRGKPGRSRRLGCDAPRPVEGLGGVSARHERDGLARLAGESGEGGFHCDLPGAVKDNASVSEAPVHGCIRMR